MLQRIVVPTDFSACADNASIEALKLATKTGSRITFLHYFKKPWFFSDTRLRHENAQRLKEHIIHLAKKAEVALPEHVDFYSKGGKLLKELPHFMAKHLVSMVVMGTKGENGNNSTNFGSNTMNFIKSTFTPVLAIPEGSQINKIEKLVYATDYKDVTGVTFDTVLRLGELFSALIIILHVRKKPESSHLKRESAFAADNMVYKYKNIEKVVLDDTDIIHGIQEFVKTHEPAFIAMSVKEDDMIRKLFHQSVFHEMILHSKTPILAAR